MKKDMLPIYLIMFGAFAGISLPLPLMGPLIISDASPFLIADHLRSIYLGVVLAAFPLGHLFGAPILGALSDRFGKKNLLVLSLSLSALNYLLSGLAIFWGEMWLLIVSRFLTGLFEGSEAIAQSYVAEIATDQDRSQLFGQMIASISLGYIAGPIIGGIFSDQNLFSFASFATPFFVVAIFVFASVFSVVFLFRPRPLTKKTSQGFAVDLKTLLNHRVYVTLLTIALFAATGKSLFLEFFASFLNMRFSLSNSDTTWIWALLAFIWGVVGLMAHKGKFLSDDSKMKLSFLLAASSLLLLAQSTSLSIVYLLSVPLIVGFATASCMYSVIISQSAPKNSLGLAMGLLASVAIFGEALAGFMGGLVLRYSDTAPFLLGAIFLCMAFMIATLFRRKTTYLQRVTV